MEFNLKEVRKEKGITQTELSQKSGVGRITISRLESGALKETTIGTMTKLAIALETNLDSLVRH